MRKTVFALALSYRWRERADSERARVVTRPSRDTTSTLRSYSLVECRSRPLSTSGVFFRRRLFVARTRRAIIRHLRLYMHALSAGHRTRFGRSAPDLTRRSTKNILFRSSTEPCNLNPSSVAAAMKDSIDATPFEPSKRLRTSAIQHTPPVLSTCERNDGSGARDGGSARRACLDSAPAPAGTEGIDACRGFVQPVGSS